ncbi:MAG: hypothetical protein ACM32O_11210 [Clostridia bacterium]
MCQEIVNVTEVQLALRQLEDQVRNVHAYVNTWNEVVVNRGLDEMKDDFEETAALAEQLRKKLHQLQHKLDDQQKATSRVITITRFNR